MFNLNFNYDPSALRRKTRSLEIQILIKPHRSARGEVRRKMKPPADLLSQTTVFPEASSVTLDYNDSMPIPQPDRALTTPLTTFLISLVIVLCFLSCAANAYILLLSRWIRGVYGTVLRLTFGLAAADCWTSLVMGVSFIVFTTPLLNNFKFENCVMLFLELFRMGSIFTSILHLLMMAVNHYQSIGVQQVARGRLSGRLLTMLMLVSWVLPPFIFFVGFWTIPGQGFATLASMGYTNDVISNNDTNMTVLIVCDHGFMRSMTYRSIIYILLLLPVIVMIGLYLCMLHTLYLLERQFVRQNRRSRSVQLKQKMLLTIIIMIGSFLMGWVPSGTWLLLTAKESSYNIPIMRNKQLLFAVSFLVNFLMILKFLVNPIIYALRIPEIHEAFKQPFSKNRHSVVASALHSYASKATRPTTLGPGSQRLLPQESSIPSRRSDFLSEIEDGGLQTSRV